MDGMDEFADFGQKVDLTASIRSILRNYPEGTAVLKELIQNADDAKARTVCFTLDLRTHDSSSLFGPKLSGFQGPSLLVYNDAVFSKEDFISIQRLGDSIKKSEDGVKIGRFGIGFNAVYHWTDLPSFVSSSSLVILDPQADILPNVNPSNPGKIVDFVAAPHFVSKYADQFTPYGIDFKKPYPGTLFRLPIRSEEQAVKSRLSKRALKEEEVLQLLDSLAKEASSMLLFLQYVQKLEIKLYREGSIEPETIFSCNISNVTPDLISKRSFIKKISNAAVPYGLVEPVDFTLLINCNLYNSVLSLSKPSSLNVAATSYVEAWEVCNQFGGSVSSAIASDASSALLKLIPWGGVAARVRTDSIASADAASSGVAYCFLPLPIATGLPIMINGFFELSSNRRDIWQAGTDMSGDGRTRAEWNVALMRDVVSPSYVRLLLRVRSHLRFSDAYQALFPTVDVKHPWSEVAQYTLEGCRHEKLMCCGLDTDSLFLGDAPKKSLFGTLTGSSNSSSPWVECKKTIILPADNKAALTSDEEFHLMEYLLQCQQPLVSCIKPLRAALEQHNVCRSIVSPLYARSMLQNLQGSFVAKTSSGGINQSVVWLPPIEKCPFLLKYVLSDLDVNSIGDELNNLPIIPLVGTTAIGTLRIFNREQARTLSELSSMGFSLSQSMFVLSRVKFNMERAMEYLSTGESIKGVDLAFDAPHATFRGESVFIICRDEEESRVFQNASCVLVDKTNIHPNELRFLQHSNVQKVTNIRSFSPELVPDILRYVLPSECFGGADIDLTQFSNRTEISNFISVFWKYASTRNEVMTTIAERISMVPCKGDKLCCFSRISALLVTTNSEKKVLSASMESILQTLGCRVIDLSVFDDDVHGMSSLFWEYVHNATSLSSLLSVFDTLFRNDGELKAFDKLSPCQKDELRLHLTTCGPVKALSEKEVKILRRLPIFKRYNNSLHVSLASNYDVKDGVAAPFSILADSSRLATSIFPSHFVEHYPEEYAILSLIGLVKITRISYYKNELLRHIQPLFENQPSDTMETVFEMLSEFPKLVAEDKNFLSFISNCSFIPSGDFSLPDEDAERDSDDSEISATKVVLKKASEMFDPHQSELVALLPVSFFPSVVFHSDSILVVLRSCGLQTIFDWPAAISCARSIELVDGDGIDVRMNKLDRGRNLIHFFDKNADRMFVVDQKPVTSFFNFGSFFGEQPANSEALSSAEYIKQLLKIKWMPVFDSPLENAVLPRKDVGCSLASPLFSRPLSDANYCSASYYLVGERITSEKFKEALKWNSSLSVMTIAKQVQDIAALFIQNRDSVHSTESELQNMKIFISSIIPQLYQRLNNMYESDGSAEVVQLLKNTPWIWVGNTFVSQDFVALTTKVNASPYIYQLPQDFSVYNNLLSIFEVKYSFSPQDYLQVLCQMAKESRSSAASSTDTSESGDLINPLEDSLLEMAVSLVTLLVADSNSLVHKEVYAPDQNKCLRLTSDLVNDDVPWLFGPEYSSIRSGCHIVHSNISSAICEKLKIKALRLVLVNENVDQELFQAFGQNESLTNRLKSILQMYPDGNPIFSELIQNADDAGASTIRIMLDENSYGTESLLGPLMSALQGPSLVVYNDAAFTEADFKSLARIGQGSKVEKLSTTGRFGLGFSSTYHITDTPSFVTGDNLVVFDPHCRHAPGANVNQPGLRLKFANGGKVNMLPMTFKDQFEPYKYFGCDFSSSINGTLFRFPLRSSSQARQSEISHQSFSVSDMKSRLVQFVEHMSDQLLFLRNLKTIEVYHCSMNEREPVLLNRATATTRDVETVNDQSLLRFFDKSTLGTGRTRDSFYAKLQSTPDDKLPLSFYKKKIVCDAHVETSDNVMSGDEKDAISVQREVFDYMIVSGLCGGEAKDMACVGASRNLKLVPLGAVAALIQKTTSVENSSVSELFPPMEGIAFCFLPLPLLTQLPIHVNAYWELSSNRRDIWQGDDTKGESKLKSEWNIHIINHVLAPLYSKLLQHAALFVSSQRLKPPTDADANNCPSLEYSVLSLLPCPIPSNIPWNNLALALFPLIQKCCFMWSNVGKGQFISPNVAALLKKPKQMESSKQQDGDIQEVNKLEKLLLCENIPIVTVKDCVYDTLLANKCVANGISPEFLRLHFSAPVNGGKQVAHPCIGKGNLQMSPTEIVQNIVFLLQYAFRDISQANYKNLFGLSLLLMEDGSVGQFAPSGDLSNTYYLATDNERKLLVKAGDVIVAADGLLGSHVSSCIRDPVFSHICNVRSLEPLLVLKMVSESFPKEWIQLNTIVVKRNQSLTDEWLRIMWNYIFENKCISLFEGVLPLLPVRFPKINEDDESTYLVKVSPTVPVLLIGAMNIDINVTNALRDLGMYIFDPEPLGRLSYSPDIGSVLNEASATGILKAFHAIFLESTKQDKAKSCTTFDPSVMNQWSNATRNALRYFLLDFVVGKLSGSIDTIDAELFLGLPIWELYDGGLGAGFCSVTSDDIANSSVQLPPVGVDEKLLCDKFLKVRPGTQDRSLYVSLGIRECLQGSFYANHLVPKIESGDAKLLDQIDDLSVVILKNLPRLEEEHPGLSDSLKTTAFIKSADGKIVAPTKLFDPASNNLTLLLPSEMFPDSQLYKNPFLLLSLRKIGLNSEITCDGILSAAQAVARELDSLLRSSSDASAIPNRESLYEGAVKRSYGIVKYMEKNIDDLLKECESDVSHASGENGSSSSAALNDGDGLLGGIWGQELRQVSFMITYMKPPHKYVDGCIPWPSRLHSIPYGTPLQCATLDNMWLCSSTHKIIISDITNETVLRVLGISKTVSGRSLALQLLNFASLYTDERNKYNDEYCDTLKSIYRKELPRLYMSMNELVATDGPSASESWLKSLSDKSILWMGEQFVDVARVAYEPLSPSINTEPFLYVVNGELLKCSLLLSALNIKQSFSPSDIVNMLFKIHNDSGETPLSAAKSDMCVGLLVVLAMFIDPDVDPEDVSSKSPVMRRRDSKAESVSTSVDKDNEAAAADTTVDSAITPKKDNTMVSLKSLGDVFVPDTNKILCKSRDLSFNDATWIKVSNQKRFCHPSISKQTAKLLGVKSLREQSYSGDVVYCPKPVALRPVVLDGSVERTMHDLTGIADGLQATGVHFVYDQRNYACDSLIHPNLSELQRTPSLVCYMDNAEAISKSDLQMLFTAPHAHMDAHSLINSSAASQTEDPVNVAIRRYPTCGKGLASAFSITDCVEIITSSDYYIYDPCGKYLFDMNEMSATGSSSADPVKPRNVAPKAVPKAQVCCNIADTDRDAMARFPDQFAPFLSLPFPAIKSDLTNRSRLTGLIIRMSLRTESSLISDFVPGEGDVQRAFIQYKGALEGSLLFARNLIVGSVKHWGLDSTEVSNCFDMSLLSSSENRSSRLKLLGDKSWKTTTLTTLFIKAYAPSELMNYVSIVTKTTPNDWLQQVDPLSVENNAWIVLTMMGLTKLRTEAIREPFRSMKLPPFISCAARITATDASLPVSAPPPTGLCFCAAGVIGVSGLPFHVDAPFLSDYPNGGILLPKANNVLAPTFGVDLTRQRLLTDVQSWNGAVFSSLFENVIPRLLTEIRDKLFLETSGSVSSKRRSSFVGSAAPVKTDTLAKVNSNATVGGFYRYWPFLSRLDSRIGAFVLQTECMSLLGSLPLFQNRSCFDTLDRNILVINPLPQDTRGYLEETLPICLAPRQVSLDIQLCGVAAYMLTAGRLREGLKREANKHCVKLKLSCGIALSLLKLCVEDLLSLNTEGQTDGEFVKRKKYGELSGTPLMLMGDSSIRTYPSHGREQVFAVLPLFHALFPDLSKNFIHPVLHSLFPQLFNNNLLFRESLFISNFSCQFLLDHILLVIPYQWRKCCAVEWDNDTTNQSNSVNTNTSVDFAVKDVVIYALWKEVLVKEVVTSLDVLDEYPLLPVRAHGKRLLVSPTLLPVLFCRLPTAEQDQTRSKLNEECEKLTLTVVNESKDLLDSLSDSDGVQSTHEWDWTKSMTDSSAGSIVNTSRDVNNSNATGIEKPVMETAMSDGDACVIPEYEESPNGQHEVVMSSSSSTMPTNDLFAAMDAIGIPVLDCSFFESPPSSLSSLPMGKKILDCLYQLQSRDVYIESFSSSGVASTAPVVPLLKFNGISLEHRHDLLKEILRAHRVSSFGPNDIMKLKKIPLFSTVDGEPVAISNTSGAFWCRTNDGLTDLPLLSVGALGSAASNIPGESSSDSTPAAILMNDENLHELYILANVEELTPAMAVKRFTIPALRKLDGNKRLEHVLKLVPKWSTFKTDAELVRQLKEIPFIPSWNSDSTSPCYGEVDHSGPVRCASEVLSWKNAALGLALAGPGLSEYFPPLGLDNGCHSLLVDLGMSQELDKDRFVKIALDIDLLFRPESSLYGLGSSLFASSSSSSTTVAPLNHEDETIMMAVDRSRRILSYLKDDDKAAGIWDTSTARKVSKLKFVPVLKPVSVMDNVGGGVNYAPAVVCFNETLSFQYGALGFSKLPILEESIAPPQFLFSSLGITTSVSSSVVVSHLGNLIQHGDLDGWNSKYTVKETFGAIFSYLQDHWSSLSPQDVSFIKGSPIVPVDNVLVKAGRLFFNLTEDLSPFMHRVPRLFGAHEQFLKKLGVKEDPLASDYVQFLGELAHECGDVALNPNELRAVIVILHSTGQCVVKEEANVASGGVASQTTSYIYHICVPDENSILRKVNQCVDNDDMWLKEKASEGLRKHGIFVVHPAVGQQCSEHLHIPKLSHILNEKLSDEDEINAYSESEALLSKFSGILHSNEFASAIAALVLKSSATSGSEESSSHLCNAGDVMDVISGLTLRFVTNMSSVLVLSDSRQTETTTVLDTMQQSFSFVQQEAAEGPVIFINCAAIKYPMTIDIAVSFGLCSLFKMDVSMACAIGNLLVVSPDEIPSLLSTFRIGCDEITIRERARGIAGSALIPSDVALAAIKPAHIFNMDEVVAIETADNSSDQTQPSGSAALRLRYARVVSSAAATTDSLGLSRVMLKAGSGTITMSSDKIYSFRSAKEAVALRRQTEGGKKADLGFLNPFKAGTIKPLPKVGAARSSSSSSDTLAAPPALKPMGVDDVSTALHGLLLRSGIPVDLDQEAMMNRILDLEAKNRRVDAELQQSRDLIDTGKQAIANVQGSLQCTICLDENVTHVLVPCGHTLCGTCLGHLVKKRECPMCRKTVAQNVKFFLASTDEDQASV